MYKWVLLGGLFAVLGFSEFNISSLIYSVFAMALGVLTLVIVRQVAAVVFERIVRRWTGTPQHGKSVRMSNSRTVF